jgi:serine/threonine-protein kinase
MSEAPTLGSCIGQYRLVREIGHGGMGIIYEAIHDEIGRHAAIKMLLPRFVDDPRYVRRFLNEARTISRVSHPGLVQIYDFGQTPSGVLYILMELLTGETLRSRLERLARQRTLFSLSESRRIVRQIASALRATHEEGIIHRDLKPANVMIVADEEAPGGERVKLLDFGIAQFVENQDTPLTAPGRALGTVTYMSPEQCVGEDGIGAATDVYALGVMLHELLTGAPPFGEATSSEVMRKHLLEEPPPLPGTLPPDLTRLVARMLAKAPSLRPAMRDVMQALASDTISEVPEARDSDKLAITETGEAREDLRRSSTKAPPSSAGTGCLEQRRGEVAKPGDAPGEESATFTAGSRLARARKAMRYGKRAGWTIALGLLGGLTLTWMPSNPEAEILVPEGMKSCPAGMVLVPRGTFQMGSPAGSGEPNEQPQHTVMLSGYCIDKTEVTVKAYETCATEKGCTAVALTVNGPNRGWTQYCNDDKHPDHPINCVDWNQAVAYCTWAGKRLPTEAEWEYAARGSDGRTYPWGDQAPSAKLLNACGTECIKGVQSSDPSANSQTMYNMDDGWVSTAPVGSFPAGASPFGVLDMAGNVYEWTADRYGVYSDKSASNPQGPKTGKSRVTRGGGWLSYNPDAEIRATSRIADTPSMRRVRLGFRCALGD